VIAGLRRWLESGGLATLSDERQAAESIRASAPIDSATIAQVNSLCHAFAYLYLLESLYDAYYVVDPDLRMVICSRGVNKLFPDVKFQPGETWSRRMIPAIDEVGQPLADSAYPLHKVIETNQPQCATLKLSAVEGERVEVECHAIPLVDDHGRLHGAAEILRNVSEAKRNPALYKELRQAANQDPLTGVANRGQLENRLAELFTDFMQGGGKEPFSVIFLDLDHFKRVNDTYDHATGDHVLITVVRLLEDELYSGETVGRYGGEEFLILCPATTLEQAVKRAERVRRTVQDALFGEEPHFHVTASLGVAQAVAEDTMDSVVQRADQALFDAKRSGRNRTCFREREDVVAPNTHTESVQRVHRHGEFVHTTQFVACQAADMLVFKLKGFVEDHQAELLDVRNNLVSLRMGKKSWRGKWGEDADKQPVDMIVSIGEREVERKSATRRVALDVTVTPVGKPRDADAFHSRATRVVELLRSYLLAD
jgi:diguanylate cyclase (GGDEF)-like protein